MPNLDRLKYNRYSKSIASLAEAASETPRLTRSKSSKSVRFGKPTFIKPTRKHSIDSVLSPTSPNNTGNEMADALKSYEVLRSVNQPGDKMPSKNMQRTKTDELCLVCEGKMVLTGNVPCPACDGTGKHFRLDEKKPLQKRKKSFVSEKIKAVLSFGRTSSENTRKPSESSLASSASNRNNSGFKVPRKEVVGKRSFDKKPESLSNTSSGTTYGSRTSSLNTAVVPNPSSTVSKSASADRVSSDGKSARTKPESKDGEKQHISPASISKQPSSSSISKQSSGNSHSKASAPSNATARRQSRELSRETSASSLASKNKPESKHSLDIQKSASHRSLNSSPSKASINTTTSNHSNGSTSSLKEVKKSGSSFNLLANLLKMRVNQKQLPSTQRKKSFSKVSSTPSRLDPGPQSEWAREAAHKRKASIPFLRRLDTNTVSVSSGSHRFATQNMQDLYSHLENDDNFSVLAEHYGAPNNIQANYSK